MVFGNNMFLTLKGLSQALCSNTFSTEIDTKLYVLIYYCHSIKVCYGSAIASSFQGSQGSIVKKPRYFHWLVVYLTLTSIFVSGDFQMKIQANRCLCMHAHFRICCALCVLYRLSAWHAPQVQCFLGYTPLHVHIQLFFGLPSQPNSLYVVNKRIFEVGDRRPELIFHSVRLMYEVSRHK